MKKKIIKLINIFLILTIVNSNFVYLNPQALEKEPSKGDLRCPENLSANATCTEIPNENGVVTEVRITYGSLDNSGDIQITKVVRKKSKLGSYDIQFEVKGKEFAPKKEAGPVYVTVIFDVSKTIESKIKQARNAIISFSKNLVETGDNFNVSLIQFAENAKERRSFANKVFTSNKFSQSGLGVSSHLEKALNLAYTKLQNVEGQKYIVLFGDGRYYIEHKSGGKCKNTGSNSNGDYSDNCTTQWSESVWGNASVEHRLDQLEDMGVKIFGIRYKGNRYNKTTAGSAKVSECKGITYGECDDIFMKKIDANYRFAGSEDQYEAIFQEVANQVTDDVNENAPTVSGELKDNIGEDFYLSGSSERYKDFYLEYVTETGILTDPFEVVIDEDAETGWNHFTNKSFTFSYKTSDGTEKTLTCNDSPEVYWVKKKLEINSCSGTVVSDTIRTSDNSTYFDKVCNEGYLDDNENYINGFSANIVVGNLKEGEKNLDLKSGLGFPTTINLNTNVRCQYKFKYQEYNEEYNNLKTSLSKATDAKEIASLTKKIDDMEASLNSYLNLIESDMNNYIERFKAQDATLKVTYADKEISDIVNFSTIGEIESKLSCDRENQNVAGVGSIPVNQTCTLYLNKDMQLPNVCLDMKSGNQENCTNDNNQVSGGNKFYTELGQYKGDIFVDILGAGYNQHLNIKLDDCTYNAVPMNPVYRQIKLSDPFIQKNNERDIGHNYLNERYSFVDIINSDLWEEENGKPKYNFQYRYTMGKQNIENIRKDTNEEGTNSYLGRNCYFNSDNKYICDFTQNIDEYNNESDFFTDYYTPNK